MWPPGQLGLLGLEQDCKDYFQYLDKHKYKHKLDQVYWVRLIKWPMKKSLGQCGAVLVGT